MAAGLTTEGTLVVTTVALPAGVELAAKDGVGMLTPTEPQSC